MAMSVDSMSPAASGRIEARRSFVSMALSVLAAMASTSSMSPADGLLAFHVQ